MTEGGGDVGGAGEVDDGEVPQGGHDTGSIRAASGVLELREVAWMLFQPRALKPSPVGSPSRRSQSGETKNWGPSTLTQPSGTC